MEVRRKDAGIIGNKTHRIAHAVTEMYSSVTKTYASK
jgi:hypothetical protein